MSSRSLLAIATLAIGLSVSHMAPASEPAPVEIAEVASRVASPRHGDLLGLMRSEAESEIAAIDWKQNRLKRRVRVAASLLKLESTQKGGALRSHAVVSAALLDPKSGALLAIVEGRAESEGRTGAAVLTERDALSGAMRGAIAAIPGAVRQMK